ncbi:MAG: hypothetical protein VKK59_05405 [Vampirovibrionales bacterium]|nr:hypothetical protein [Vampirovibrionales bacterium]
MPHFGMGKPRAINAILPDHITPQAAQRICRVFGGEIIISTHTGSHCLVDFRRSSSGHTQPITTIAQKRGGKFETHQILFCIRDATGQTLPKIKAVINKNFHKLKI